MRLIDADALMHTHKSEVATIGKDWTVGDLATAIELAPTIDAIPVGWLRNEADRQKDMGEWADADVIYWLIQTWQKEQEAQDG